VLFKPWVVLGALDGEVQGNFQAVVGSGLDQATEILTAAQLRVNRLMPALRAADGIRTARIIGACGE